MVKVSSTFSPFGSLGSSVVTTAGFGSGTSGISGTVILSGTFDLSGVFGLSSGFFSGFDFSFLLFVYVLGFLLLLFVFVLDYF